MKHTIISVRSVQNPLIKQIALLKQTKHRKQRKLFIAEGVRTIKTVAESNLTLEYLFTTDKQIEHAYSFAQPKTTIISCTEPVLAKISSIKSTPGLLAVFKEPICTLDQFKAPGIVLANITDPGNMGTLIRSAAAFNTKTVIIVEGVDPWSSKVIQASAGAIGMINLFEYSWQELVHVCSVKKIVLNALVVDGEKIIHNNKKQLLVVGNEAHGLHLDWQKDCHLKSCIAMPGNTESLNVAVAGSIGLYELVKLH